MKEGNLKEEGLEGRERREANMNEINKCNLQAR